MIKSKCLMIQTIQLSSSFPYINENTVPRSSSASDKHLQDLCELPFRQTTILYRVHRA